MTASRAIARLLRAQNHSSNSSTAAAIHNSTAVSPCGLDGEPATSSGARHCRAHASGMVTIAAGHKVPKGNEKDLILNA